MKNVEYYIVTQMDTIKKVYEKENLDKVAVIKETLLMGFRYINGPDKELFYDRFGLKIEDIIPKTIAKWQDRNLLNSDGEHIALTKEGLLLLNSFLTDCLIEVDKYFGN
ncbi:hypothetical protein FACS1894102_2630 [Spirochaetia bacterium]|nr:hypothetical protein FACS1894102_2630 [Spirochaetia bacterium]